MALWSEKEKLEARGVKLVALVHEAIPEEIEDFLKGNFWGGPLYHDKTRAMFKALGDGHTRKGGLSSMLDYRFWGQLWNKWGKMPDGNLKGNGLVFGGSLIFGSDGTQCYEFKEKFFGDHPEMEDVYASLGKCEGVSKM